MIPVVPARAMALMQSRHREQGLVHMALDCSAQETLPKVLGRVLKEYLLMM